MAQAFGCAALSVEEAAIYADGGFTFVSPEPAGALQSDKQDKDFSVTALTYQDTERQRHRGWDLLPGNFTYARLATMLCKWQRFAFWQ